MNRACAGQTVLDLFPAPPRDHVEDTLKLMCDVHGCIRGEIEGEVRELYRDFGTVEAFDRCKALVHFRDGKRCHEPLGCTTTRQVGVFDPDVEGRLGVGPLLGGDPRPADGAGVQIEKLGLRPQEARELDGMRRPTGEDAIRAAALLLSIPLLLACLPLIAYDWIKERIK